MSTTCLRAFLATVCREVGGSPPDEYKIVFFFIKNDLFCLSAISQAGKPARVKKGKSGAVQEQKQKGTGKKGIGECIINVVQIGVT